MNYLSLGVLMLLCCQWTLATRIQVSPEGGYSEIIIGIDQDVDEDEDIVNHIKELLTEASEILYVATKGTVFFEEVTIALPSTWTHKPEYESSLKNNMKDADIVVASLEYTDEPLTIQPGGCGEQGLNIHLTPNYLRNMKEKSSISISGIPGKRFVQEWAKFRYGVFEEFVTQEMEKDKRFSRYYEDDTGKKVPSICTAKMGEEVFYLNKRGLPCDPNVNPVGCYYRMYNEYVSENASLMYTVSFDSVNTFCDDKNHNRRAPNKHNIVCGYKSVWNVISSHKDFKTVPIANVFRPRNTVPNFTFVRTIKDSGKTVLILDISGSMGFFNKAPIKLLHQTATSHILESVPDGSQLGIVVFGTNSKTTHPMTKVDNSTRKTLAAAIPTEANGGGTAIGKGLLEGLEVLKRSGVVEGGVLLLITDGEENEDPRIADVRETLLEERVVISVIAYGDKADKKLESLALETGGRASFFRDITNAETANTQQLNDMLLQASTAQADVKFEPVRVKTSGFILHTQETKDIVILDHELGKNTVFYFSWTRDVSPEIELISPSGIHYNWQSQGTFYAKEKNKIRYKFPDAETGSWTVVIRKRLDENPDISFTLVSEPKDPRKQPVRVKSWMSSVEIDPVANQSFARIYAKVTKSDVPVLNATVVAIISGPGSSKKIRLSDDGKGEDTTEDDGLYTGAATVSTFTGNGRYTVRARVSGSKRGASLKLRRKYKTRRTKSGKRPKRSSDVAFEWLVAGGDDDEENEENPVETNRSERDGDVTREFSLPDDTPDDETDTITAVQPLETDENGDEIVPGSDEDVDEDYDEIFEEEFTGPFERDEEAGTIVVSNWTPNIKDTVKPSRVSDLSLTNDTWDGDAKRVTLSWTESGDDLTNEIASSIEMRMSNVIDDLIDHFDNQSLKIDFLDGDLVPGNPGEVKMVNLLISANVPNVRNYLAIRYIDEAGNKGDVSNIVTVSFVKPLDICQREGDNKCADLNGFCVLDTLKSSGYICNCSYGIPLQNEGEICTDICTAKGKHLCSNSDADCVVDEPENITFSCIPRKDSCELGGDVACAVFGANCAVDQSDKSQFHCVCPEGQSKNNDGACVDACELIGNQECSQVNALCNLNQTDNSTYVCECPVGLTFDVDGICSDICVTKGREICENRHAICAVDEMDNGTFTCLCPAGLSFNDDDRCSNICELKGDSHCATLRANCHVNDEDNSTFTCLCSSELTFNDEGKCVDSCELIGDNHCATLRASCALNEEDNSTFTCQCLEGLEPDMDGMCLDGCEIAGDEICSTKNATCILNSEDKSDFSCQCPIGLFEDDNQICVDICTLKGDTSCSEFKAECVISDQDNSTFYCKCPKGFYENSDGICGDICELKGDSECQSRKAECRVNQTDTSTFYCECPSGLFEDENRICGDICRVKGDSECQDFRAECRVDETDNSTYYCECPAGLFEDENQTCGDICRVKGDSECQDRKAECRVNKTDNSTYYCECPVGLFEDDTQTCENICRTMGDNACSELKAECVVSSQENTTFYCECSAGYYENQDGICGDICEAKGDIECQNLNAECHVNETNNSTYYCQCPIGLFPDSDSKCVDICEIEGNNNCSDIKAVCVPKSSDNSTYKCECYPGLVLSENGKCEDVCEREGKEICAKNNAHCVLDISCECTDIFCSMSQDSSKYTCKCNEGFTMDDNGVCADACTIKGNDICNKSNAICEVKSDDPSSFSCVCPTGLEKNEEDICSDTCELLGNEICSEKNAVCILGVEPSTFKCECPDGLLLDADGLCFDVCVVNGSKECSKLNATCVIDESNPLLYDCQCTDGYSKSKTTGSCVDVCQSTGDEVCALLNAVCTVSPNEVSTYSCNCPANTYPDSKGVCVDACAARGFKECAVQNAKCVLDNTNKNGFTCDCPIGLFRDRNGACADICQAKGKEICERKKAFCEINPSNPTVYSCKCRPPFSPLPNGKCTNKDVDVRIYDKNQTVLQGQKVIFRCRDEGKRRLEVKWARKDGRALPSLTSDHQGELTIRYAQPHDSGIYICHVVGAPNRKGYKKRAKLRVLPVSCPPNTFQCRSAKCINRNLRCNGRKDCPGSDNSDELYCPWTSVRPIKPVTPVNRERITTTPSPFTPYKYAPLMDDPNRVSNVNIKVYDGEQSIIQGGNAIFRCRDEGPKRYQVQWLRADGDPMTTRANIEGGRLKIVDVQPSDAGSYICKAVGASQLDSEASQTAVLKVEPCQGYFCSVVRRFKRFIGN